MYWDFINKKYGLLDLLSHGPTHKREVKKTDPGNRILASNQHRHRGRGSCHHLGRTSAPQRTEDPREATREIRGPRTKETERG